MILLSQQGDQQALEEVLERHRGIVKGIAAGFVVSAEEREDLLQEGMIGLWKAVQAYRKGGGANFAALARVCVRRRMISALRKMRIYVELPPQDERLRLPWVVRETLLSTMSALERKVFDRYLAGDSYAEVAVDLKIPPKMVDNALQRAKKKAQRRLGVEERVRRGAERLGRHSTGR